MPVCGCIQGCNCYLSEDGRALGIVGLGRNFTQVEGSGTTEDPYVVHFLDSEEFRPKTAEVLFENQSVPNFVTNFTRVKSLSPVAPGSTVVYESPITFLLKEPTTGDPGLAFANYFYMGASVTFAETADAISASRALVLVTTQLTVPTSYVIAGQIGPGGSGDPITLSVEGYTMGRFDAVPGLDANVQAFQLFVMQDSGGPIMLTDIRFWMTQI